LDQELIPYRYTHLVIGVLVVICVVGDTLQKP